MLDPHQMFRDDKYWEVNDDLLMPVIPVKPHPNPMVLKAEKIFKEALQK